MVRRPQGRHRLSCREFPEARPACREAPETLRLTWVLTSGETEVRGMWVFSPGETPGARKVGGSPGEIGGARKTGVPRTKVFTMYWTIIAYTRLKCQFAGGTLHVYECEGELTCNCINSA